MFTKEELRRIKLALGYFIENQSLPEDVYFKVEDLWQKTTDILDKE